MDQENEVPLLFRFYFGDSAASAQRGASTRLKKWSRAFETWMAERKLYYPKDAVQRTVMAFRRLVRQCGRMPWEVTQEDIELHAAWLEQQGFAARTINFTLGIIASFFQWCDEQKVDPACAPGFNPAKKNARLKINLFEGACLWSRKELEVFLDLLKRDESELGKREYAFFLLRLNLGVSLEHLRMLKWEQIELDEAGVWVSWRQAGERVRLPEPVWQALREYLRASGRLDGMRAGKYIFAPLNTTGREVTGAKAEDWLEEKPLTTRAILNSLKLYGRQVGIADEKLNLMALRRTAIRLKMDQGESLQGMKIFMHTRVPIAHVKYKLGKLPQMPGESSIDVDRQVEVPVRVLKPYQPGDHTTHGFYSHKKDGLALQAVLAQDIHGLEQEITCLRKLMRGLREREGDEARRMEAYSQAAYRLGSLVSAGEPVKNVKEDPWAEQFLTFLDGIEVQEGRPPVSQEIRANALGVSSEAAGARGILTEEIATLRLLLRNVHLRAMQGIETREYMRLLDLYSLGCVRLGRLIKIGGCDGNGRLERYLQDMLDEAIRQLNQERKLDRED